MADAIFISYRRDDSEGEAGRLFDDLTRAFGDNAVFMDVAGIKPGVDFRKAIEDNVASCGVFLAVVGPTWIGIENPDGKRRLDDPNDFVALEIASALKREVPVIPVLVHDAKMPAVDLLPDALKSFAYHNSVEISHARWSSDVALLIEALKAYVTPKSSAAEAPVHATVPVQLPAPHHPDGHLVPDVAMNWKPMTIGAVGGIVLIAIVVALFLLKPHRESASLAPAVTPSQAVPVGAPSVSTNVPASTALVGSWVRTGGGGDRDALGKLVIANSGSQWTVHAFGRCQAAECDWHSQLGVFDGTTIIATFSPPPNGEDTSRTATVIAHTVPGGLDVLIRNAFQNPAGPHGSTSHQFFISTP